jgi:DNA segregation ATPase FtsK/SpoIIIE-like protein
MSDMPSADELLASIAARARASEEAVESVLATAGVSLDPPLPAQRSLLVHRMYVRGVKAGAEAGTNGPFERDIVLGPGAWAIASEINLAGKSSMLWALTWPLRGQPDETYQRSDTSRWFQYLRVDAEVAQVPMSFRVCLENGALREGTLLTADSIGHLTALNGDERSGPGVRTVTSVATQDAYAATVGRLMLERLGLVPLHLFSADPSAPREEDGHRDGGKRTHGWPAYFCVIALASASDSILFGHTAVGQLPTRYMQVFLDVPFAADVMGAEVSARESRQATRHAARRESADAAVRAQRWQPLRDELAEAEQRLGSLRAARPDLPARVRQAQESTRALLPLQARATRAQGELEDARRARIHDGRELRRASESAAARTLFAALDPHSCPRCEAGIDQRRRLREEEDGQCAVCSSPLEIPQASDADREALLADLRQRLAASRAAEQAASGAALDAERDLARAAATAENAVSAAAREQGQADYVAALRAAESDVARLKGALEVVATLGSSEPADDDNESIMEAARDILKQVAAGATRELFAELNDEILTLSHRLGIANLKSVTLDLAGKVNARLSANPKPTSFSALSPGERLRLRIAVVASLIRVGRRRGIRSHPGLLVIDSPTDVELVAGDAETLFSELCALGEEEGIQIIIATTNQAVWNALPPERIIAGPGRQYLF